MKIKTLALILLMTLSIGAVVLISGEPIEMETYDSLSLKHFVNSLTKSMVVYAEPMRGGPGSFL